MIAKLAAGWRVRNQLEGTSEDIAAVAKATWFAVVGLTAGSKRQLDSLRRTIAQIRRVSRNQAVGDMVRWRMSTTRPELARDVGADETSSNAPADVIVAQKLFDLAAATFRDSAPG